MSKPNRGKAVRGLPNKGRGVCPICKTSAIKLLYTKIINGEEIKVCKRCQKIKK